VDHDGLDSNGESNAVMAHKLKIAFETDGNAWHGMTAEHLWATPVGISLYRLENSPLYAYGISYQDVVVARENAGASLRFVSVQDSGGHSTYRVVLKGAATKSDFETYWKPIERLASRPFLNSPLTIEEILSTGPGIPERAILSVAQ
jgi:hypothetical protein